MFCPLFHFLYDSFELPPLKSFLWVLWRHWCGLKCMFWWILSTVWKIFHHFSLDNWGFKSLWLVFSWVVDWVWYIRLVLRSPGIVGLERSIGIVFNYTNVRVYVSNSESWFLHAGLRTFLSYDQFLDVSPHSLLISPSCSYNRLNSFVFDPNWSDLSHKRTLIPLPTLL